MRQVLFLLLLVLSGCQAERSSAWSATNHQEKQAVNSLERAHQRWQHHERVLAEAKQKSREAYKEYAGKLISLVDQRVAGYERRFRFEPLRAAASQNDPGNLFAKERLALSELIAKEASLAHDAQTVLDRILRLITQLTELQKEKLQKQQSKKSVSVN